MSYIHHIRYNYKEMKAHNSTLYISRRSVGLLDVCDFYKSLKLFRDVRKGCSQSNLKQSCISWCLNAHEHEYEVCVCDGHDVCVCGVCLCVVYIAFVFVINHAKT